MLSSSLYQNIALINFNAFVVRCGPNLEAFLRPGELSGNEFLMLWIGNHDLKFAFLPYVIIPHVEFCIFPIDVSSSASALVFKKLPI